MTRSKANIIPAFRYRNAPAAIEWLCNAFGFEKKAVYPGPDGSIAHAELVLGDSMIMLGSVTDTPFGKHLKQPDEIGGFVTHSIYVVVEDPDAHHDRAVKMGAEILRPPTTQDYGGRDYSCRDLEGHVWSFGSYDPWASA